MHKLNPAPNWLTLMALTMLAVVPVSAQNDATPAGSALHFGTVNLDFQKPATYTPSQAQFAGKVKMTSENYDLACETLTFFFDKAKGKAKAGSGGLSGALSKVMAESDPVARTQITADIRRPLDSQTFHIQADQAVYVPDKTHPGNVRMDFTGHVKVITNSGFLAEPSVTTTDHATILMGPGENYPQLETGPGHITVTPAQ